MFFLSTVSEMQLSVNWWSIWWWHWGMRYSCVPDSIFLMIVISRRLILFYWKPTAFRVAAVRESSKYLCLLVFFSFFFLQFISAIARWKAVTVYLRIYIYSIQHLIIGDLFIISRLRLKRTGTWTTLIYGKEPIHWLRWLTLKTNFVEDECSFFINWIPLIFSI